MVDYVGLERDWRGQAGVVAKTFIDLGLAPTGIMAASSSHLMSLYKIKLNAILYS